MPAKPAWLLRIPEIVHELQALPVPVIDRSIVNACSVFAAGELSR